MGPDHLLMFGVDFADIVVMDVLANVDGGQTMLDHVDQTCRDVT